MVDLLAAKRARMACRVYLKLYDAGPHGAPVTTDDTLGLRDHSSEDFAEAIEVVARFVDDTILDEPGHAGGVPHYALTAGMRGRMDGSLADQVRADLARVDRGEDVPDETWLHAEQTIRTGRYGGDPL